MKGLIRRYKQGDHDIDERLRHQLILDYSPLIRFVAQRIASRLPPSIDIDDLVSSGVIGLMDAIEKYDPNMYNKFKTYAEFRIRGAILDELRSQDWIPRSVRNKAKVIERAHRELEQKFGRPPTHEEVCESLGMELGEYHELLSRVKSVTLVYVDESVPGRGESFRKTLLEAVEKPSKTPQTLLDDKINRKVLIEQIEELPRKMRLVLSLYYYEELNLKEIGKILNVTESRVSQLHTQAVQRIRTKLNISLMGS
ncbi:MAG: FliA/WhiG family RNA polymerase sigma factor [Proteobacteria bacterium]|nr:FliA/WhiG family RNA polymerase sigma factor [Pseudomonadota bacterium]